MEDTTKPPEAVGGQGQGQGQGEASESGGGGENQAGATTVRPRGGTGRRVLVAGATGYLGKHIVRECKTRGFIVRALARSEDKLAWAREYVDEVCVAEATQPATLHGICDGVDTLISCLGITRQAAATYKEVDYGANAYLLSLALHANVRRVVFVSLLHADRVEFTDMVGAREQFVRELKASPIQWVVIRPTGFFTDVKEFLDMAVTGRVWLLGDGSSRLNPIHGADLAVLCTDAIDSDPSTELECGGPEILSQREIGEMAFKALNDQSPICTGVPFWRAWNPLAMVTELAKHDAVAPRFGQRKLMDFFMEELKEERESRGVTAEAKKTQ